MGNFYVNFSVKGADAEQVARLLEREKRQAIVASAENDFVVAYDEEADNQSTKIILGLGSLLSRELECPTLAVLNHDDDVLCYWLFAWGKLSDSYNSDPDAFVEEDGTPPWQAGDAGTLCAVLGRPDHAQEVEAILRDDYVFAVERHEQLAAVLGLPGWSVGFGYNYVASGELEEEPGAPSLIHVRSINS